MKQSKFLTVLPAVGVVIAALFMCLGHHVHPGTVLCGVAMIGSQDMRIAYTNAYRSLWNKATNNGKLTGKLGDANGPSWLPNVGQKILSQSDIITEIPLNVNKTTYQFGINVNQVMNGTPGVAERRLNLQDTFFVAQVGYYFRLANSGGGAGTSFQSHLFTHPPGQTFGAVDLNRADALWDGNLTLSVNNRTIVPEWDLWRHYETPQLQYPQWSTFVPTQQYPVNDEHYGGQSGMYPTEPMWILDGAYENVLNLTFNQALNNAGLGITTVYMRVVLRGILAQNCSKLMEPGLMLPGGGS